MFSAEPSYYAISQGSIVTLRGVNFDEIPNDAVALVSYSNVRPLRWIGHSAYYMPISNKTDESLVVTVNPRESSNVYGYIGAIISPDGQQVYWVNDTEPLP